MLKINFSIKKVEIFICHLNIEFWNKFLIQLL